MLRLGILTIFPEIFESYLNKSIFKRAQEQKIVAIDIVNIRDFTEDKHRTVDDKPFGGGAGMLMMVEPVLRARENLIKEWKNEGVQKIETFLFDARGKILTQEFLVKYSLNIQKRKENSGLIFIVPRYEGIDARIEAVVDYVISIGPYILSGAELAALVFIDAFLRLLPGVLGNKQSLENETTFTFKGDKLLVTKEYPQYTRPRTVIINNKEYSVPSVLLTGDHKKIAKWREQHTQVSQLDFLRADDVKDLE